MNTIANWCSAVFLINLTKRPDRLKEAQQQLAAVGLFDAVAPGAEPYAAQKNFVRFEAYGDLIDQEGRNNGNMGCTNSHRALLEIIAFNRYERALVLEDDFMLRPAIAQAFPHLFHQMTLELPAAWRMLYLGGGYGEAPKRRHSEHLIETNSVMTTSSYIINWRQARRMAPYICGVGPIDSLYHGFNREGGCYMVQPRFFVQSPGYSDLQERHSSNAMSMEDEAHEDMLLSGTWETEAPTGQLNSRFKSRVQRREVTMPSDLRGAHVIVDGQPYVVVYVEFSPHIPPRPWFRGEPCTYILRLP